MERYDVRTLRWLGVLTGFAIGEIMLFHELLAGPATKRIVLILGICVITEGIVFLIVRHPWK